MADPYLDRGEYFIITTHRISTGYAIYDMMLTTRNLVLVDSSSVRFEPEKIPLSSILSVTAGKVATGEPVIILNFFETGGELEKQPMNLLFTQQPGEQRKSERDLWVQNLMQQIVAVRQMEDSGGGTVIVNGEGYIHLTSAPLREIETAQPHKSVVTTEPESVELAVLHEKQPLPAPAAIAAPDLLQKEPAIPEKDTGQENVQVPDVVVNRPADQSLVIPREKGAVIAPVEPFPPVQQEETPGEVAKETDAPPDPFAAAILAMKEREKTPDILFAPSPAEPGDVPPEEEKTGFFGRTLHSLSIPFTKRGVDRSKAIEGEFIHAPGDTEPVVPKPIWPILPPEPEPVMIPVQKEPAPAAAVSPLENVARDGVAPADETKPSDIRPGPRSPAGMIIGIGLACIVILAIFIVIIAYPSGNTEIPHAVTVPTPPVPSTTVPVPSAKEPPSLTLSAVSPPAISSGVWIRVTYNGSFIGQVGNPGTLQNIGGTGEHYYWIRNADALIQASLQKQDYSADFLLVTVYRNGTEIYSNKISAPKGSLDFIIDPYTGGFPGGIPTPTSATGLVPGERYWY